MAANLALAARLSSAVGDRTQGANKRLAAELAESGGAEAVDELVRLAGSGAKPLATDAIKVIGELSFNRPDLLPAHIDKLVRIAETGRGVHLWESLVALASVAEYSPGAMAGRWHVFETGLASNSVIARDHSVRGLCALAHGGNYRPVMDALLAMLQTCPVLQFPTYAERIAKVVRTGDRQRLVDVLERRIGEMPNPAKARRVSALLRRLA